MAFFQTYYLLQKKIVGLKQKFSQFFGTKLMKQKVRKLLHKVCIFFNKNMIKRCVLKFHHELEMLRGFLQVALALFINVRADVITKTHRILNGDPVHGIDHFPFMAALSGRKCGASIINRHIVMTAGHCCEAKTPEMGADLGSVVVGASDKNVERFKEHKIDKYLYHSGFSSQNFTAHDICLIKALD